MPHPNDADAGQDSPNRVSSTTGSKPGEPVGTDLLVQAGVRSMTNSEFYSPIPDGYKKGNHKYVVILGTVMSGLGKGIFSSSMAKVLKDKGLRVAPIKCEGYLNIDSGTLNPYRHGEVFVLNDGTECDMDLGTYERMLNQNLTKHNFVTSGQIYSEILDRERQGVYLGRDVQMIPHVTGDVKRRLRELALRGDGTGPADIVFVEVGGTVGDYENGFYIEALRELAFEEGPGSVCFVALTYVIEPKALGEQKSKAAQLGIKRLMESGIQPHIIACRASNIVEHKVMEKIAMFSNVPMDRVFSMHDRDSIYTIPDELRNEGLDREILSILNLHDRVDVRQEDVARRQWATFVDGLVAEKRHSIKVAITGKYADLMDAYASIQKSLEHCAAHLRCEVNLNWIDTTNINDANVLERLGEYDAVIVPGGFGSRGVEGKISVVKYCRESGTPFLGICLGFQVAVIEYARNVLGMKDAYSTEFDPMCGSPLISELPDQKKIEGLGGTMRLGAQDVEIVPNTLAAFLAGGKRSIHERFRHRYEVEPEFIEKLEAAGLIFSGRHPEQPIMQILELPSDPEGAMGDDAITHPYFIGAQFHPELTSRPLMPQPMFMGLVAAGLATKYQPDTDVWNKLYSSNAALRTWLFARKNGKTQPAN
ncbi:MAG: CTP synthase (glutamine hydrolyzing) [Phycisphaerales bacterium]|nr:CTP synthase (glutamine hydrolyzing) [Phycisphaerales bacterium]